MRKKFPSMTSAIGLLTLGLALSLSSGCTLAIIGTGAAVKSYVQGLYTCVEPASLDEVAAAADSAIDDLGVTITRDRRGEDKASLRGRTADDRRFRLRLVGMGAEQTEIRLRIGFFGDEEVSKIIVAAMREKLQPDWGTEPPVALWIFADAE